jgi:threonine/homoserine/homoserine lactone efflux protein
VIAALLAGLLAGYSIAIPVGPMTTYLVALTARTSIRVGVAAALGIATVDGMYAAGAILGGAALAEFIRPALGVLHRVSVAVLVGVAARAAWSGLRLAPADPVGGGRAVRALSPTRAYATLAGLTLINPTTLVYFVALVIGLRAGSTPSALGEAVFVVAAFAASANWQLVLACAGGVLGRALTGNRGHRVTAVASGLLTGVLAVRLAVG